MTLPWSTVVALCFLFHPAPLDSAGPQQRGGGVIPEHLQQLATAEAKWVRSKVEAYEFRVQPACNGLIPPSPPGVSAPPYRVKHGQTVAVAPTMDKYNTVEKQFAFIRHVLQAKPFAIDVEYDPSRGYATRVCVSPQGIPDDGYGFLVTDFKALSDAGRTP